VSYGISDPGPITVTTDNVADDGHLGEHDNVGSDIAHVNGTAGNDAITSSVPGAYLEGWGGDDVLTLLAPGTAFGWGGNDTLNGSAGDDELDGWTGNDVLKGNLGKDRLSGGAGDDTVDGGPGHDSLDGDSYSDTGNDLLLARDGEPDDVTCGLGTDQAQIDTGLESSVSGCETFLP
jgi:Ca2+-binding RTX toxin-like protein